MMMVMEMVKIVVEASSAVVAVGWYGRQHREDQKLNPYILLLSQSMILVGTYL